jgi:hypothetical protein
MLVQYVDVPFVASTCPAVPVALFESRSSPVRRRAEMVDVASCDVPVAVRLAVVMLLAKSAVSDVVASVVVPLTARLVSVAFVAEKLVEKRFVEVLFVVEALVATSEVMVVFTNTALVPNKLVEVLFVVTRLVIVPVELVSVAMVPLVADSVFALREVAVVVANVDVPLTARLVIVVVASVEAPDTVSVPCEVNEEVAMIVPPVSELIVPATALRSEA